MARCHRSLEADFGGQKLEVWKEMLESVRQLYITLGQLKYKKHRKLIEVDDEIRTAHIQMEFCVETFDAKAKAFSEKKKELYHIRSSLEAELEILTEKMSAVLARLLPVEEALQQQGVDFLHPIQELEETNVHRMAKLIDYKESLENVEETRIREERLAIRRDYAARSPTHALPQVLQFNTPLHPQPATIAYAAATPPRQSPAPPISPAPPVSPHSGTPRKATSPSVGTPAAQRPTPGTPGSGLLPKVVIL